MRVAAVAARSDLTTNEAGALVLVTLPLASRVSMDHVHVPAASLLGGAQAVALVVAVLIAPCGEVQVTR